MLNRTGVARDKKVRRWIRVYKSLDFSIDTEALPKRIRKSRGVGGLGQYLGIGEPRSEPDPV